MSFERWKDIAELIGLTAVVASLVFVGMELRQNTVEAANVRFTRYLDNRREINALIAANAELWRRGCLGEELTPAEEIVFARIWGNYISWQSIVWASAQQSNPVGYDVRFISHRLAANLHRYPGLRQQQDALAEWTKLTASGLAGDTLGNAVSQRLVELEELEPEPLSDARFCGA